MNASIKSYLSKTHISQFILMSPTGVILSGQSVPNLDGELPTESMINIDKILI
ncbi:MAG: hypothetical protein JJP05_06610 [cyanobacterium endosymbiont of Rhopalodia gibba]